MLVPLLLCIVPVVLSFPSLLIVWKIVARPSTWTLFNFNMMGVCLATGLTLYFYIKNIIFFDRNFVPCLHSRVVDVCSDKG